MSITHHPRNEVLVKAEVHYGIIELDEISGSSSSENLFPDRSVNFSNGTSDEILKVNLHQTAEHLTSSNINCVSTTLNTNFEAPQSNAVAKLMPARLVTQNGKRERNLSLPNANSSYWNTEPNIGNLSNEVSSIEIEHSNVNKYTHVENQLSQHSSEQFDLKKDDDKRIVQINAAKR